MFKEIKQVDTQRHASWKNKIKNGTANKIAGVIAITSIVGIGCRNTEPINPTEFPSPTPAVSEYQAPTSTEKLIEHQNVDQLKQQKNAIYSEIIYKMEAGVDNYGQQYFVGFNDVYRSRDGKGGNRGILLLRERILDKSGMPIWILITHDGPRSLRAKDPDDIEIIEAFINDGIMQAGKAESYYRLNANPTGVSTNDMRIGAILGGKSFKFDSAEPTRDMIEEAIKLSQMRARESTEMETKLNDAKNLSETLTPLINPSQPPQ